MNVNEDWLVSLSVAESDGQTRAEARLAMPGGASLAGCGQTPSGVAPEFADIKTEDARALVREFLGSGGPGGWLPPDMTAALLHCYEIPLAELVPVHGEDDAVAAFAAGGVPVVLKADVAGLVHKTDAGGVELDLRTEAEVAALFG
jgi:acyl-CoA synthetase (NDP forming)